MPDYNMCPRKLSGQTHIAARRHLWNRSRSRVPILDTMTLLGTEEIQLSLSSVCIFVNVYFPGKYYSNITFWFNLWAECPSWCCWNYQPIYCHLCPSMTLLRTRMKSQLIGRLLIWCLLFSPRWLVQSYAYHQGPTEPSWLYPKKQRDRCKIIDILPYCKVETQPTSSHGEPGYST